MKSNFSIDLDFKPLGLWPDTVPVVAMDGQLLCGFHLNDTHPVFEHAFQNPEQALALFKSLYPQLTLPEVARLTLSPSFSKYFQLESLLRAYQFSNTPELQEVLQTLILMPATFQNFVSLKKMGPQELVPLLALDDAKRKFVADEVILANESRQDSVKRIELLSDLIQMNHSEVSLKNLNLPALVQKRFPVTSSRDENLKTSPLPWLSQIKSQFKRRGDKAGFEVQFFAGTPAELNKLAQNLSKVAESWNSQK